MVLYNSGTGCTRISMQLDIPFSEVYNVIKEHYPEFNVRLRVTST